MEGLVLFVLVGSITSEAVRVWLPPVLKVTLRFWVPATSAVLAGRVALVSLQVIAITSVTLVMRFQKASTALTVTLRAAPAVCAVGVPVLPEAVPGAAASPGASSWIFAKGAAPTTTLLEVVLVRLVLVKLIVIVSATL